MVTNIATLTAMSAAMLATWPRMRQTSRRSFL
jgi:hypothetical protein